MNKDLVECKVAIIGAGYTAKEHIRAFSDVPGVKLVGIHSRTRERAEQLAKEYYIPSVYDSVEELYKKTFADLVVVTVPELSMREVSIACFEYPWTVLLEKPAGYNVEDAAAIIDVSKKKCRNVFVALNRRFHASTRYVMSDIMESNSQRFIKVQDQQDQKTALLAGQPKEVAENWMYANSIHVIDYFRMFGRGNIVQVDPVVPWNPHNPGIVISKVIFDSGDIGLYEGIWNGPGPWAVTIATSEKRWEMRPLEQAIYQNKGERILHTVELDARDTMFKPGFRLQAEHAVAAALGNKSDSCSIATAFETMQIVQKIFSSV